jgi:hypothetical protein
MTSRQSTLAGGRCNLVVRRPPPLASDDEAPSKGFGFARLCGAVAANRPAGFSGQTSSLQHYAATALEARQHQQGLIARPRLLPVQQPPAQGLHHRLARVGAIAHRNAPHVKALRYNAARADCTLRSDRISQPDWASSSRVSALDVGRCPTGEWRLRGGLAASALVGAWLGKGRFSEPSRCLSLKPGAHRPFFRDP